MNILFACHRLPFPPKRGGKIRPFNIIRHFKEQGHRVTVGSLARSPEELEEGQGLREYCDRLHVGLINPVAAVARMVVRLPSPTPSTMGYFYSRSLHNDMQAELRNKEFDLVFVHCSSAAQYVRSQHGAPSVLDFGDMDSQKWLDYSSYRKQPLATGYWIEGSKMHRAEAQLARQFDLCTCTTRAELDTLQGMNVAESTGWFPNGVDADYFCPTDEPYDPNAICFIGRMDYYPNQQCMLHFCEKVFPKVRQSNPEATLTIVGASPSREIRNLADHEGVTVTGTVDDVRPHVRRAALSIAPLAIARGTQNKILESMAMGVPVICSTTAAGGVDAVPEEHILTAESPDDYTRQIMRLLGQPAERQRFALAGRERALANHNWAASMQKLDGLLASLGERRR